VIKGRSGIFDWRLGNCELKIESRKSLPGLPFLLLRHGFTPINTDLLVGCQIHPVILSKTPFLPFFSPALTRAEFFTFFHFFLDCLDWRC
jgi:hypothetical protein